MEALGFDKTDNHEDADMILLLHRSDYYRKDGLTDGKATCHLAKNRQGPTGVIDMIFIPEQFKFAQMADETLYS